MAEDQLDCLADKIADRLLNVNAWPGLLTVACQP